MKRLIYTKDNANVLVDIFKKLFPEYKDILVVEKKKSIFVIFVKVNNPLWRILLPNITTVKRSLYETLITDVPKRLSYRKAKNLSFSYNYLMQIAYVLDEAPELILDFLKTEVDKLPKYPKTTIQDVFEETQKIENKFSESKESIIREGFGIMLVEDQGSFLQKLITNKLY